MMIVLEEVMRITTNAQSKNDKCTTWQMRVQLASTILDLMLIDTEVRPNAHLLQNNINLAFSLQNWIASKGSLWHL